MNEKICDKVEKNRTYLEAKKYIVILSFTNFYLSPFHSLRLTLRYCEEKFNFKKYPVPAFFCSTIFLYLEYYAILVQLTNHR